MYNYLLIYGVMCCSVCVLWRDMATARHGTAWHGMGMAWCGIYLKLTVVIIIIITA